ncbi:hypothetical protein Syun_010156 [Stephania yunnanensis]|uniref:F-box domain-containing protein n=1 Tax=Stephania yunnanensis TaxID=152371 RepID=A0AAP0KIB5_9MAGN
MEAPWLQRRSCCRINDLPDNLIHHILSFLPIKDVIRTSYISKRWRYLWTSVPSLDFDGLVFDPQMKFVKFVDSILSHRSNSAIEKFCLRFGSDYCRLPHVHAWVLTAVRNNVRELSIAFHTEQSFQLPSCMFTCRTLQVLSLNLYNSVLKLVPPINLPVLKTLRLSSVRFRDDNLTQLLSNCPLLENLHLEACVISAHINVFSHSLQRLTIDGSPKQFLLDHSGVKNGIRVFAPRLLSFTYRNHHAQCIHLEDVSSVVQASISLEFDWDVNHIVCGQRVSNSLEGLLNVKVLTLSSATVVLLSAASGLLGRLPAFPKLVQLYVSIVLGKDHFRALTCFVHNSPNLEFLSVNIPHRQVLYYRNLWQRWFDKECFKPENAPYECTFRQLKTVKINGFIGDEDELAFVKYLLKRASVLEKMIIVFSNQLSANLELQMKTRDNILLHPRASSSSEIICQSVPVIGTHPRNGRKSLQ